MSTETQQQGHEQLVRFLSQFERYRYADGAPKVNVVPQTRNATDAKDIAVQDINQAVFVLTDVLNLEAAVVADIDLLELVQVYLRVPQARTEMNKLIKSHFSKVYGL